MCGICGAVAFGDGFAVDATTLVRMRDTLKHRGPDGAGVWAPEGQPVGFGHRRLSIIDLSDAGAQPMSNEDGTIWITYNGEVYNHAALRDELERKGHVYRSQTDTESIIHLYEEEGERCVERLEGMFAFAIWDARRKALFLARDRVGVKPLYYCATSGGFVFGSEVKAILAHPSVTRDLNEEGLYHYLTFSFAPPPLTLYQGISKLAPAERMTVRLDSSISHDRYWSPFSAAVAGDVAQMSEAEQREQLLALLRDSIGKRMMSDVPFGVFLSGGLDSSTNVALMAELQAGPVRTFTTAPRGHARYDELEYARLVARRFGTDHHEVTFDDEDMLEVLSDLFFHLDEPTSEYTCVPQHFVSKLARDTGTIVVQMGEGADELFHGYRGYADHRHYVVPFQRFVPSPMRRGVARAGVRLLERLGRGVRHRQTLVDAARSRLPYWGGALAFRGDDKERVLARPLPYPDSYAYVEALWDEAERAQPRADLFQRMTYVELRQRLAELLLMRMDKVAMANSVEGREPFLDHHLVEFALALPPAMKYRNGKGKYILRSAVSGIVPSEILQRPKQGFGTPMEEWLRGDFGKRAQERVTRSALQERGLFDLDEVERMFAAHRAGHGDWTLQLWNLYNVSSWYDTWIARRARG